MNAPKGKHQRKLKNLLIDPQFQLKYVGYLVGIAVLLSGSLGIILWRTSDQVIRQSEANVSQGEKIVTLGSEVVEESRKVSAVVRMNIIRDPIYQDDPALLDAFAADTAEQDKRLDEQKKKLEDQRTTLAAEAQALTQFHHRLLISLVGVLSLLVLGIGAAGVFVTHKVAGPVFKMRRHLLEVTAGKLEVPWALRKGDELVDFFETFRAMVAALRNRRQEELVAFDKIFQTYSAEMPAEMQKEMLALRGDLAQGLENADPS
ncbi:MAG: HAMP domain-containing protein [Polyangiaceae bacterium]|nr:HAMP domain-containing protein [Polyangiaceae bacterium]